MSRDSFKEMEKKMKEMMEEEMSGRGRSKEDSPTSLFTALECFSEGDSGRSFAS